MFHYIRENLDFDQLIWEFGTDSKDQTGSMFRIKKMALKEVKSLKLRETLKEKLITKTGKLSQMKTNTLFLAAAVSTTMSFICSYFLELYMGNAEQYLALIAVVFVDGFFGISAGIKREGFQTRKAVRVLKEQ